MAAPLEYVFYPVLLTPAEDLPGVWVSHCLPLGLVSQGNSVPEAVEAIQEAIAMVVDDDTTAGLDPNDRKGALAAEWERWEAVMTRGRSWDQAHINNDVGDVAGLVAGGVAPLLFA